MTPASEILTELQPLLDALCEETITPEQTQRLEELVLMHPEAEAHYIRFMSFQADLIGHFAGLPEPATAPEPGTATAEPKADPATAKKASRVPSWQAIAWVAVIGTVGGLIGSQVYGYAARARDVARAEEKIAERRAELARVQAEQAATREEQRRPLAAALAREAELAQEYTTARNDARRAIEEKEFVVRLSGPTHVQPGAPNKWTVETLRHGAVGRPKRLDLIVKDARGGELLRKTDDKPVGATNLELPVAFWERVKPGTDLFLEVVAHTNDDRKSVLAERLSLARPVYVTHLVTDKPLYKPGEVVRFRSLTLDRSTLKPPAHEQHLAFKLRDPADTVTPLATGNGRVLRDLKPVNGPDDQPLRGLGVGEHALSADAPGGEYKLDLYEVESGTQKEVLLETRKFIVNRYVPDVFEKKLEFDGKSYGPGDVVQARIEVSRTAGGPMKDARANVVAASGDKPFHEQPNARFTTSEGKTYLDVRFKLPAEVFEKVAPGAVPNATLSVNVVDGSDAEPIVRPIPLVTKNLKVEFFPEGGEMVENVPGRVYFMVRTPGAAGKPADLKGTITDGTNTIAEVSTLTDAENPGVNRGHGAFVLTPKPGVKYFLKVSSPLGITPPTPNGFPLPAAKPDGVALTALDAATPRGGAVRVRLHSARGPKTLHVGAYARGNLVAHQKVELEANAPLDVSLKGDESAGGVTRVTVFEELSGDAPGRTALVPRAERLVFRGSGEHLVLDAKPDRDRYTPGGKVKLDLSARNEKGQSTPAVLLVGVVNRSVITMADNKHDRLQSTHFLLSGEVRNSAELEHADFLLTDHPKAAVALDLLLGTQGWRRFAEQDVAPPQAEDRADVDQMLVAHGQRLTAPLELFKLEEQRIAAEFAPRVEQVRLATAAVEDEFNALSAKGNEAVTAANAAVSAAQIKKSVATSELNEYSERFDTARDAAVPVLTVVLVLTLAFLGFKGLVAATGAGRSRATLVTAGLVVLGVLVLIAVKSVTSAKKSAPTFEFVGSSIKPPGAGGGELFFRKSPLEADARAAMEAAPMAPVPLTGIGPQGPRKGIDLAGGTPAPKGPTPVGVPSSPAPAGFFPAGRGLVLDRNQRTPPQVGVKPSPEKEWLAHALAQRPVGGKVALGPPVRDGFPEAPVLDPVAQSTARPVTPTVTPSVVREYAHERDPALGEVRADFAETVYWHPVLVLPATGTASVEFQLSDDIARYQVLVAGHTLDGRVGAITKTIEARKPFSLDPKLPLEVAHTDTIDVPVRVTNDSAVRRNVAFATTATGFKTDGSLKGAINLDPFKSGRQFLKLNADTRDGPASLVIEGTSIPAADKDVIRRTVRVVPDGFPGVGAFSDMLEKGRATSSVTLPKDVVPGTLKVRLEMYPTSMSDLVKGLDGLLREPHGCFEQTSTTNYPNALILDYLNQSNQANPEAATRARGLLDRGYGRLTSFECPDTPNRVKHGFEWFGKADSQHEALTAYGLLQFKDMARVHPVDPELIKRTQAFLLSRRDGKGGFLRNARALDGFGGSPKPTTDAYIVWALVESDPEDKEKLDLRTEITALKTAALDENSATGRDAYTVALAANVALLRGDRETGHKLLDRLKEKHAKGGAVTGGIMSITRSGGRDLQIETTALALLGWLRANDPSYATAAKESIKWIAQQRGGYGGFGSTQSTIMALKALALHAQKNKHPAEAGELRLLVDGTVAATRTFTPNDVDVIGLDVPNPETVFKLGGRNEIAIATDAKQPYPFALSYTYTTLTPLSAERCAVRIATKLASAEAAEGDTVPLAVTLENRQKQGQGMTTAVIGIPAGMKVPTDLKQLTDLREKGAVAYFELKGSRELVLYWRELAPEQKVELSIDLVCDVPGTYRGPASRGYLYYDADHKHWVEPLSIRIAPAAGNE
ncbi:A-macroglobulin complement component [Gemmata obscuriglobus]|nr:alpha-2-macroglobulin family protein [Gemmata obscuriglobus]QEG31859.1 A-macroglobulin complement component [Gemmata obscuriglobus]VTS11205.1 a-macroglobulin complement component : A-macroglobulin complement component OS=Haliangium ochraceum (strain DSM 14365 / JCM 11303 / SMP-2) GN=Hoch_3167 PE=4 SV=1: A2M_N: A2M: Thiol-ester_cl: A2M_comp [Gemmata obscuriglobus UQM 2246]